MGWEMTESLVQLADDVLTAAEALRDVRSRGYVRSRISTVRDELEGYQRRLEAINEFVSECREAGVQVAIEPVPKAALDALDDLQELVEKDPTLIDTSGNLVRSAKILEAIVENRRESVIGAWQDHCATVIPVPQPQLLNLLQRSSSTEDAAGELDSLDRNLEFLRRADPLEKRGIPAALSLAVESRQRVWESINLAQVPATVMAFVETASAEGVTLGAIPDEVMEWLKDNSLIDGYRVVPRSG